MSNLVFALQLPHPPILIPDIGGSRLKDVEKTQKALEEAGKRLKEKKPDTIVIISPHGKVAYDGLPIYTEKSFQGDFGDFGAGKVAMSYSGDPDLAIALLAACKEEGIKTYEVKETFLDHGVLVPLYYPYVAGVRPKLLPVAMAFMSKADLHAFGKVLAKVIEEGKKKVAVVASGDLSHRLTPDAPAGFEPRGKEFDQKIVSLIKKGNFAGIADIDPGLAEVAGECGYRPIIILGGLLENYAYDPEVLSYEGPFGVGYMVAAFEVKGKKK